MIARPVRALAMVAAIVATAGTACTRRPPARTYQLEGQVLAVHPDRQQITIRHGDIEGFMPGMTMSFPVASPDLLAGREPGELVRATLEVTDSVGRLTAIERSGFSALPADSNAASLADLLDVGAEIPDAAFVDQSDRRRAFSEWRGHIVALTFIYTRCPLPDFCPLMDRHFAAIQRAVKTDPALEHEVKLISMTFDPDYDTPAVLAAHAARLQADPAIWTFLTGDRATIDRFAARLGVGLVRPPGGTEVIHNLRTVLVDRNGRIVRIYSGNDWTPAAMLAEIRAIAPVR